MDRRTDGWMIPGVFGVEGTYSCSLCFFGEKKPFPFLKPGFVEWEKVEMEPVYDGYRCGGNVSVDRV